MLYCETSAAIVVEIFQWVSLCFPVDRKDKVDMQNFTDAIPIVSEHIGGLNLGMDHIWLIKETTTT